MKSNKKHNLKEKVAVEIFKSALPTLLKRYDESIEKQNGCSFYTYCELLAGLVENLYSEGKENKLD